MEWARFSRRRNRSHQFDGGHRRASRWNSPGNATYRNLAISVEATRPFPTVLESPRPRINPERNASQGEREMIAITGATRRTGKPLRRLSVLQEAASAD